MSVVTTSRVGESFDGQAKQGGDGALAENRCIYFAPAFASRVLKHDTSTNISTLVGDDYDYLTDKWYGGVYTNNSVYFVPFCSNQVLKLDCNTDTTTKIGKEFIVQGIGDFKYRGGVLGDDGCVYFPPYDAEQIIRVDPSNNDECTFIGQKYDGDKKWDGGVLALNKSIYFLPSKNNMVIKLDLTTYKTT